MHHCSCADGTDDAVDLSALAPIFERYAEEPGTLIPVLQHVQEAYGYLPAAALAEIARVLGMPYADVYGVATFYTQFHLTPQGRTVVRICQGTACHVAGAPEITRAITDELDVDVGETSEDLRFSVEGVACVGCCGLAPVVMVDDQTHGQIDPSTARRLARTLRREASA